MRVTVCQIDPRPESLNDGLHALTDHISAEKSDFLLLPEMAFSEWLAADPVPDASRWLRAVTEHERRIESLAVLGAEAVVGTRPVINQAGSRRNQAYLWTEDDGVRPIHEKYYLPDEEGYWEHTWYDRGEKRFDTARALGMRIGVQICTELWFFEWARQFAADRVDILCIPRATPHETTEKWLAGGQSAAICSGAYCLSSNLWCPPGDRANCGGVAWITDPEGNLLAKTDRERPFATVDIDLAFSRESKTTYPRYVPE